jgi:hypothetical protein
MKADLSLPGKGGWSTPPPIARGVRAAIFTRMKFVALRLAKRRIGTHVRSATEGYFHTIRTTNPADLPCRQIYIRPALITIIPVWMTIIPISNMRTLKLYYIRH